MALLEEQWRWWLITPPPPTGGQPPLRNVRRPIKGFLRQLDLQPRVLFTMGCQWVLIYMGRYLLQVSSSPDRADGPFPDSAAFILLWHLVPQKCLIMFYLRNFWRFPWSTHNPVSQPLRISLTISFTFHAMCALCRIRSCLWQEVGDLILNNSATVIVCLMKLSLA